jgi:integrase
MVRDKRRPDNPCKGIALPKSQDTEEKATFLTQEEWRLVKAELTDPYRALFDFLILTGLRFSEATALEGRHFQEARSGQHIVKVTQAWTRDEDNHSYIGPPKTPQSRRSVALPSKTYSKFRPFFMSAQTTGSFVFLNTTNTPIDHRRAWDVWDAAVKKAQKNGLAKRPRIHDLRHSNASWLLQAGLDMYKLQKHLGHKSITTTLDRYSHLLPEGLRETTAAMERAFETASDED